MFMNILSKMWLTRIHMKYFGIQEKHFIDNQNTIIHFSNSFKKFHNNLHFFIYENCIRKITSHCQTSSTVDF